MKLARPDVFHPRVVLAGWPQQPTGDGDDAGLVNALRHRGLHARWLAWDDPEVVHADLVILRATRDYARRLDEFLSWTTRVANVLNARSVVAWNVDRRYLSDLADRGVPTVPGEVYAPGEQVRLPRKGQVFVGPTVGTGTRRCNARFAAEFVARLHAAGHAVLVQPGGPAVETVLVFLGGEPSHAFIEQADTLRPAEPDFETWDVGAAALAAATAQVGVDPGDVLYARAHVIGGSRDPRLLELQLVDPSLGWQWLDADTRDVVQRDFALCVESALQRLGLGPLSHRGP
ncbi:hypothetical protein [Mycobacterium decipiens]|uniref:ATP-grasp domain-containing protein n=1 Tax=Mycobacterium decipiens TaxID=1430326 RepID=A0A1X2LUV0_9MYCO|nr:hypothetical protein [Mycobacterium decipiens]OSC40787.1 hypothetical protein B8W66_11430 [Mycobacterium decipiens]